jgi:hypothetical protein
VQEWAFADLRLAPALRKACATAQATGLEDWITQSAIENDRQIPELFVPSTGDYAGPVPMLGFGAGLYLLAMQEREQNNALCPDVVPAPFDSPVTAIYTPACSCSEAESASAIPVVAALLLWRRRIRRA